MEKQPHNLTRKRRRRRVRRVRSSRYISRKWMAVLITLSMGAVAAAPVGLFALYQMTPSASSVPSGVQVGSNSSDTGVQGEPTPRARAITANALALGEERAASLRDRDHLGCAFDFEPPAPDAALSVAAKVAGVGGGSDELEPTVAGRDDDNAESIENVPLLPRPLPAPEAGVESEAPVLSNELVNLYPLGATARPTGAPVAPARAALVVADPFSGLPLIVASTAAGPAAEVTTRSSVSTDLAGATADVTPGAEEVVVTPLRVSDGDVHGGTDPVIGGLILEGTGRLVPGHSPGILPIQDGNYVMDAGILEIEIAGLELGEFDRIEVRDGGEARLSGGEIQISFIDGFAPSAGDRFEFLFASGGILDDDDFGPDEVTVSVARLEPGLDYLINASDGFGLELEIVAGAVAAQASGAAASTATAPAPGTWLLMLAGISILTVRRRVCCKT